MIFPSQRSALRRHFKNQRRALSRNFRRLAARRMAFHAMAQPRLHRMRRIGAYLPVHGELDTMPLIHLLLARHKQVFVPVLPSLRCAVLQFAPYTQGCARVPGCALRRNRYGIAEPRQRGQRARWFLDALFMPLLAFDGQGNRLGMGGGFYDRALARQRTRQRPWRIGVGYEFQAIAALPSQPWDVPLHAAVTERGWRNFPRGRRV